MDVQPYLIKYFEEIKEHADESGYMFKRLKGAPTSTALDEVSMFHELERVHFLLGSKELDEIKRAPVPTEEDGMLFFRRRKAKRLRPSQVHRAFQRDALPLRGRQRALRLDRVRRNRRHHRSLRNVGGNGRARRDQRKA